MRRRGGREREEGKENGEGKGRGKAAIGLPILFCFRSHSL